MVSCPGFLPTDSPKSPWYPSTWKYTNEIIFANLSCTEVFASKQVNCFLTHAFKIKISKNSTDIWRWRWENTKWTHLALLTPPPPPPLAFFCLSTDVRFQFAMYGLSLLQLSVRIRGRILCKRLHNKPTFVRFPSPILKNVVTQKQPTSWLLWVPMWI